MEMILPRLLPRAASAPVHAKSLRLSACANQFHNSHVRYFNASNSLCLREQERHQVQHEGADAQPSHKVSQNITSEEKAQYESMVQHSKERQMRSPWMREGSDQPPVARQRSAGAVTKGVFRWQRCVERQDGMRQC